MRLKTKLIPVASLGLIASTIIPINATSCSKSNSAIGHSYNLVKNYFPTIERYTPEVRRIKIHDLNNIYFNQLQENLETFVQDYFWSKSWTGVSFEQFLFWEKLVNDTLDPYTNNIQNNDDVDRIILGPVSDYYHEDIEIIKDVSMTAETVTWKNQEWKIPLLSFTLQFDSTVLPVFFREPAFGEEMLSGTVSGRVNGSVSFYNVPFYIAARTVMGQQTEIQNQVISFEPFFEWMSNDGSVSKPVPDWKIKTVVNSTLTGEITYITGATQRVADDWIINVEANPQHPDWQYENLSLSNTIGCVFTNSYYLEKVQVEVE